MTSYAVEDDALLAWATSHAIIAVEADLAADPAEAPWLEAWRQCARHLPTLDAVLGDLRAGVEADAQVVPRLYLLDDLEQLPPPSA